MPANEPEHKRPLVFLHLPRTGGTTLYNLLSTYFDSRAVYPWSQRIAGVSTDLIGGYHLFGGHYAYSEIEPLCGATITFLRQPVERAWSLYKFWRAQSPEQIRLSGQRYMLAAHRLAFKDFLVAEDEIVKLNLRDGMTALLGSDDYPAYREVTRADYDRACARLEAMAFVGLREFYEDAVRMLCASLLLPLPALVPMLNASADPAAAGRGHAPPIEEPSPAAYGLAADLNRFDADLYLHASTLFAALRRRRPAYRVAISGVLRPTVRRMTEVRFGTGEAGNALLIAGWSHPEDGFVWSDGETAEIALQTREPVPRGTTLALRLRPYVNSRHPSLIARISVDSRPLLQAVFARSGAAVPLELAGDSRAVLLATDGDQEIALPVPLRGLEEGEHRLCLQFALPCSPASLGESSDFRSLGVALSALQLG